MGPPPQGLCFRVVPPWPWGTGVGGGELESRMMEGSDGGTGGGGLRFFLQFDPGKVDLGVSLSALFGRVLEWARTGDDVRESSVPVPVPVPAAATVVSAAALAAAVSACLAAAHASRHRPYLPRQPRRSGAAMVMRDGPRTSTSASAEARPRGGLLRRATPGGDDAGLRRILPSSSNKDDESSDNHNVIHGASIGGGAGDDEPVIVARVANTARADTDTPVATADRGTERDEEAERLSELWLSLENRERRLELRLRELREREAAAGELENRVAAAGMEARMLELRVSTLQEENGRLRARLEEMGDARDELARAGEKLRAIRATVREEREEARREAEALRARVAELETGREERDKALVAEAAALREVNAKLEEDNMELALRLRDAEQAASSARLAIQAQADMVEEAQRLRETNEMLTRQIEEMRGDQYAHVEELVYLKWVNACLRHELRDHGLHPPYSAQHQDHDDGSGNVANGGVCAMDLSRSMSFRSSERAKQLMLRYGHPGLDPALLSPLHESIDGDEHARSPAGTSSVATTTATGKKSGGRGNKLKFLGNFKKLLPGGGGSKRSHSSSHGGRESSRREAPPPPPAPSADDEYLEKAMRWLSTHHDVLDFDHSYETTPLSSCDRTPPSTATTATTRGGGGARHHQLEEDAAQLSAPTLARSMSDGGKSYGREASRYHSLRPDHPADEAGDAPPEKWERRRHSDELRSSGAARG